MEKTLDVVIYMSKVYDFDVYASLDPRANFPFVTLFLENRFNVCLEVLLEPSEVCTLVGELIVAKRVYRSCPIFILHKVVPCDLIELSIVDFDVILGMNWLHATYASIDCRTR